MTIDMEQIREDCIIRIENLLDAIGNLKLAMVNIDHADVAAKQAYKGWDEHHDLGKLTTAAYAVCEMTLDQLKGKLHDNLTQAGALIARDVIAPVARAGAGPIVWLTSNSYMPPIRDISDVERVWIADESGEEAFSTLVEAIESKLDQEQVYMACPEYDNALYVVDLKRWEHTADDTPADDLNDEWQSRDV